MSYDYADVRAVGGQMVRACPVCGREEPPPLRGETFLVDRPVKCPCGYQYRRLADPTERMRQIVEDLYKQAAADRKREAAREQAERIQQQVDERLRRSNAQREQREQQRAGVGIHPDSEYRPPVARPASPAKESPKPPPPATPATKEPPPATTPATHPPRSTQIHPNPPESTQIHPDPPKPTRWKASPELALRMWKAREAHAREKFARGVTAFDRREIQRHLQLEQKRFLASCNQRARQSLNRFLDEHEDLFPLIEPVTVGSPFFGRRRHA